MLTKARKARKSRIRSKIIGTAKSPRLSIFRSARFIYGQLIDDQKGVTLAAATDKESKDKGTKVEKAFKAGESLASLAKAKKIKNVVFDRGGFRYHGRVKAFADGARKGGLVF